MKILVTGASGFIGRSLCLHLQAKGFSVRALMRSPSAAIADYECLFGELDNEEFLSEALSGVDAVVHLAGRAHQFGKAAEDVSAMFKVNRDLTLKLAAIAEKRGVKRFIFVSSIGVNGAQTGLAPIDETTPASPVKDYALSKYEAEVGLRRSYVEGASTMELVIIRPPLVYAANAPGNFQRLLKLVRTGLPLPFSGVANRRSMISLDNLTDFIRVCTVHPSAAGELFLVSDDDDLSLPEIIEALSAGMGKRSRVFYFPVGIMYAVGKLAGKHALVTQLCGSFVVTPAKAMKVLGWTPPFSSRDELFRSARGFLLSAEKCRSRPE
ncbi:Nucleoside-diphosphate-sugar epimerase [Pseudomonas sp. NFACC15-1]|uniref:NAD-dependent epimerase/dehydratase family protein n=1 Tax=unclassified Pseudomonas TaxID=196821 RepID=UPI0008899100|nr:MULTISPECIES: NAD-dependent epimerase/dehydratase family protein [unclassified Pseudomonas]SDA43074.1 Nucleoside-diphosphate-sugar epimerase [Pseudomonas sp. NFACC15-1]SDW46446.1 Nucleoside-diphosphate-sugar epimerase [Pseudomonas sp. NFACC14]